METTKPKKKRRCDGSWKKNITNKQRNSEEAYVSSKTKIGNSSKNPPSEVRKFVR